MRKSADFSLNKQKKERKRNNMQKHDRNPDSEEMQKATNENKKAAFATKTTVFTAIESEETEEELIGYTKKYISIYY